MAAAPDVRTRRRRQTRDEILAAAWELAEQHGIAGVSLREVARGVGLQPPSLYTYFPSKGAIFDAMFAQGYRELDEVYRTLEVDPNDPVGSLTEGTVAFVRFCQASVPRYQLLFTRAIVGWEPAPEAYAVSVDAYEHMAGRLTAIGIAGERVLDLWSAVVAGLAAQQLANDPDGDRWVRLSRDAAQMFLDHIGG